MGILAILFMTIRLEPAVAQDVEITTIGYDCDGNTIRYLGAISLVDIDICYSEIEQVKMFSENVVLQKLKKYQYTEIIQCKVEMSSHNLTINNATYIHQITQDACRNAHLFGTMSINNVVLNDLKVNSTVSRSIVLPGFHTSNENGDIKITLKSGLVRADVESDTIHLASGFRCKLSNQQCIDTDGGYTFWKSVPNSYYTNSTYSKLYEGEASKFESEPETVYSVNVDVTSFSDAMKHNCKLEMETLKNTLQIVYTQPDEFAFRYMGGPGYVAVLAGETIHIVQCEPVEVRVDHVEKCYNRLPVLRGNDSMFLTPRTRIISKYATELSCNSPLLEHYKLQGTWYKFNPNPVPVSPIPSTKRTWNHQNMGNLASSGNYTEQDLDSMRERIMFPVEQNVIVETLVQQLTGGSGGPMSFSYIFSEDVMEQIAENIWSKTWGKYIGFGTTCAGFIGIFVCFSLLQTVGDAVINGYALYKMFGWSFKLFGACWDTVAYILLAKGKENNKSNRISTLNVNEKLELKTKWFGKREFKIVPATPA